MLRYTIVRLLWMIPVFIGMSLIVFVMMHNIPGSPLDPYGANRALTEEEQATIAAKYGLDQPLHIQYVRYIGNLLRGDLGESLARRGQSVSEIIGRGIRTSMTLGLMAIGIAIVIGLALGLTAAANQNGPIDYACTMFGTMGVAFPNFVLAVFLIYLFVLQWNIIPRTGGLTEPIDWVLPTIALALGPMAIIARYVRSSMVEVIRSDYVRTARAKGAREHRVMVRHVLKNGLIPPLTILAPLVAAICTGSPAVETIFRIPGIGRYFADSIVQRDYSMIMAVVLLFGVFLAFMNLLVDLLYGVVDPRIRYS